MLLHPVDGQERPYVSTLLWTKVNSRGVYFQAYSAIIPQQQALVPQKRHHVKHAAPCAGRHAAGTGCSRACWVRSPIYRFRHAHPAHDPLAPARPRRSKTLRIRNTRPGGNTPFRSARRYKAEGDAAWIIVLDSIPYPSLNPLMRKIETAAPTGNSALSICLLPRGARFP